MDISALKKRCIDKLAINAKRIRDSIPYTTEYGKYNDMSDEKNVWWWTNSFWSGILRELYDETGDQEYCIWAEGVEKKLSDVLHNRFGNLDHDLGFLWLLTGVEDYKHTGSESSKNDALIAASVLASRFNIKGSYIRAWNNWGSINNAGKAIIDCMMNLPLLYWAGEESDNVIFKHIAMAHADTVIKHFMRPDGSSKHIVCFDENTGEYLSEDGGQGMREGSEWTRGQGWCIYGMAQSYFWTKEQRYLDAAKRCADNFIKNSKKWSYKIPCDFCQPVDEELYDSSAAAIAACGMTEIYKHTGDKVYLDEAINLIDACDKYFCPWDDAENEALLDKGCVRYSEQRHIALIYGDYYFFHAIRELDKLLGE